MRKLIALMAGMLMAGVAHSRGTVHFALDNRTGERVCSITGENLRYDASWLEKGSTAKITDNGILLVSGTNGTYHWAPTVCGDHQLKLIVSESNGSEVGTSAVAFLLNHDQEMTKSAIEPTCTMAGRTVEVKCMRCGETLEASRELAALGHSGKASIVPTIGRPGVTMEIRCSRCGEVLQSPTVIPALDSNAAISISDVEVFSGYPWQEVVIGYTISGSEDGPLMLEVTAKDKATGKTFVCKTLEGVNLGEGRHVIKWNASLDGAKFKSDSVAFTIRVKRCPLYCVVDLSGGPSATRYPVMEYVGAPIGEWMDEYKETRLVLRRIEAGTFTMGSASESDNQPHQVTLTKPFYMGVFEVTWKQWELVMETNLSYHASASYASHPFGGVTYNMIRGSSVGSGWPVNNAVDADSFLGKLRAKTGLAFDLPTEAQWEYACRAGTTSDYNNGGSSEEDLMQLGRYSGNENVAVSYLDPSSSDVGCYQPNAWGLHDMHGNVSEWCLDWYGALGTMTDPKGAGSGSYRVFRGGDYSDEANCCTSSHRAYNTPAVSKHGFRLSIPLQQ